MKKTHKGTRNRVFALVMGIALTLGILPGVGLRAFASEAGDESTPIVVMVDDAELSVTSFGYAGTYDGEAHAITISVENEGVEAEFWYGAEELTDQNYKTAGSKDSITRTEVGATTVYYYVCADGYESVSGSETITVKDAGKGGVETETKVGKDAPKVVASKLDDFAKSQLTTEDNVAIEAGKVVKVSLRSTALKETAVAKADKEVLEKEATELAAAPGAWMNLSLYKQVTGQDPQLIKETDTALNLTMTVPDSLKNTDTSKTRTFYLIGCYDGKARVAAQSTDTELKSELKQFSTFLIAYADEDVVEPTPTPTTDMYTLTFDANGGTGTMDPMTLRKGEAANLEANKFVREGYVFDSWNTKAGGKGTKVSNEGKVTLISDVTLYAQWTKAGENPTGSNTSSTASSRDYEEYHPSMGSDSSGFTSTGKTITYTITQKVPAWVSTMRTWVDLEGVLEYAMGADGVTVKPEGGDPISANVSMDGQRLMVSLDDVTPYRERNLQIVYQAKLRAGANLTPYLNPRGNIASVPYQAHTVFDNDESNVLDSKSESITFSVGSSSSGSGTSTSGGSTSSTKTSSNTLAKTADPTSVTGVVVMAISGAAALVCSRRRAA